MNSNNLHGDVNKSDLIFIPDFIYRLISRNGLTYNDFLNLDKIREYFSLEDLKYVQNLNENINKILNNTSKEVTVENYLDIYWKKSNIYEQLLGVTNLDFDSLLNRLSDNNGIPSNKEPYEIIDTHTTVVIFVINSTIVDGGKIKEEFSCKLVREFLQILYGYNSYSTLSKNPVFTLYLDNIASNNSQLQQP